MLFPAGVLVPPNLVAGNGDDVRLAITVEISNDDLVAADKAGVNAVRSESRARRIT